MDNDNERLNREISPDAIAAPEAPAHNEFPVEMAGVVRRGLSTCLDVVGAVFLGFFLLLHDAFMDLQATIEPRWSVLDQAADIVVRYPGFAWLAFQSVLAGLLCWHLTFMVLVGRTPGHLLAGLSLVDHQARQPTLVRVLFHGVFRLGSLCLMCSGHAWFFIDLERRTLYDRLAGLYLVVHSPLKISE